jgi:hypothetical protein
MKNRKRREAQARGQIEMRPDEVKAFVKIFPEARPGGHAAYHPCNRLMLPRRDQA